MLSSHTLYAVALISLTACCRTPTEATLAGTWEMEKSAYRIVFHSDHTVSFTNDQGAIDGTWTIAGRVLTIRLWQHSRPENEAVETYHAPKICGDRLVLGPSYVTSRIAGRPMGEGEELVTGATYRRAR
jgi:hypothetical protein